MSREFFDLYTTDGIRPTQKEPEPLPWERCDVQGLAKWLRPVASSNTCDKVQDEALARELLGETATALGDLSAEAQFRQKTPLLPAPIAPVATAAFAKLASRLQEVQKRAPERQRAIADILAKLRRKVGGSSEAWERLAHSCEALISSSVLAEIGENFQQPSSFPRW